MNNDDTDILAGFLDSEFIRSNNRCAMPPHPQDGFQVHTYYGDEGTKIGVGLFEIVVPIEVIPSYLILCKILRNPKISRVTNTISGIYHNLIFSDEDSWEFRYYAAHHEPKQISPNDRQIQRFLNYFVGVPY